MPRLGKDISAVWIATHPRTGSMWTTNVVREIVRVEGMQVVPPEAFKLDDKTLAYGQAHIAENRAGIAVLKVHKPVPVLPRSAGIVTRRDVRDAMMSYMRFMRLPFERGVRWANAVLRAGPNVLYPGEPRLVVDYVAISQDPVRVVREIAAFLGAELAVGRSEEISAKLSKTAVKQLVDAAHQAVVDKVRAGEKVDANRVVVLSQKNWRAYDPSTGFQSGHVSDYRDGDWQTLLTEEQKAVINRLIESAGHALV